MKNLGKRFLAILLIISMIFTSHAVITFAESTDSETAETTKVEIVVKDSEDEGDVATKSNTTYDATDDEDMNNNQQEEAEDEVITTTEAKSNEEDIANPSEVAEVSENENEDIETASDSEIVLENLSSEKTAELDGDTIATISDVEIVIATTSNTVKEAEEEQFGGTLIDWMYYTLDGDTLHITGTSTAGSGTVELERDGSIAWTGLNPSNITTAIFDSTVNAETGKGLFRYFRNLTSVQNLDRFDTSECTSFDSMFKNCESLQTIDVSVLNTSKLQYMSQMFSNCFSLTDVIFSDSFDTSKVKQFQMMFQECKALTELDIYGFDSSAAINLTKMFYNCISLTKIIASKNFDGSNITTGTETFYGCTQLEGGKHTRFDTDGTDNCQYARIDHGPATMTPGYFTGRPCMYWYLDSTETEIHYTKNNVAGSTGIINDPIVYDGLDANIMQNKITKAVFDDEIHTEATADLFAHFDSLTTIEHFERFKTENATDMSRMFFYCVSLPSLDLSSFDTSNVTSMHTMFCHCESLTTLDLRSFDTSNVTEMYNMFNVCSALERLDLSSFDTRNCTHFGTMFPYDRNLKKVIVSDDFVVDPTANTGNMFIYCDSIRGEKGTVFDSAHIDGEYARVDGGTTAPGYFWHKDTKEVTSFTINTPPTKTAYFVGETFDPTGLVVDVTYDDGTVGQMSYATTPDKFSFTPAGALALTDTAVTIKLNDATQTQAITVTKQASSISILTDPTTLLYSKGDKFDPTGLSIHIEYTDSTSDDITYTDATASGFTFNPPLTQEFTDADVGHKVSVTYAGRTCEITSLTPIHADGFAYINYDPTSNVKSVAYDLDRATLVSLLDTAIANGAIGFHEIAASGFNDAKNKYNKNTPDTLTKEQVLSKFDAYAGGKLFIGGTFNPVTSITINIPPTKTAYFVGDSFDPAGLTVSVTYQDGLIRQFSYPTDAFRFSFTVSDPLSLNDIKATATIYNQNLDIPIAVTKQAVSMNIVKNPNNLLYSKGDTFDPTGLVIHIVYRDGSSEDIIYNDSTAAGFTFDPALNHVFTDADVGHRVNVIYAGKTAEISAMKPIQNDSFVYINYNVSTDTKTAAYDVSRDALVEMLDEALMNDALGFYVIAANGIDDALKKYNKDTPETLTKDEVLDKFDSYTGGKLFIGPSFKEPDPWDVKSIKLSPSSTVKTTYKLYDSFNPSGIILSVTHYNGVTEDVPYLGNETKFNFAPPLGSVLRGSTNKITIIYSKRTVNLPIIVITPDNDKGGSSATSGPMGDLTKNQNYVNLVNQPTQVNTVNNIAQDKLITNNELVVALQAYDENVSRPRINAKDDQGNTGFGQWQRVPGTSTWYFLSGDFNANGTKGTVGFISNGWYNLGWEGLDKWYHFAADGVMQKGWYQEDNKIYYLQEDLNDNWYGKAVTGEQVINGQVYHFDDNGVFLY